MSSEVRKEAFVDMLELNHRVRDDGSEFSQWILWDWQPQLRQFVVVDWMLAKEDDVYRMVACRYELPWRPCGPVQTLIRARAFRETRTRNDPEVENQQIWTIAARRQLW